jgi:hypothetical protein
VKDLSEGYIRREIDKILTGLKLGELKKEESSGKEKKFIGLVVYAASNERVQKSIKIIKKIFGYQLKILLLKES